MIHTKESGFSLVELAIVILITGILMGGSFSLMKPYLQSAQRNATKMRLENVAQALALYQQNYDRLPCPGNPAETNLALYGTPRNSGASGTDTDKTCGSNASTEHIGILPYKVLGLEEDQAKDSYGNMLTYAVSPAVARLDATVRVHGQCRTATWIDDASVPVVNRNAPKARFCCPEQIGSDILVQDTSTGGAIKAFQPDHNLNPSAYSLANVAGTATEFNTRFIAFALISHGINGDGAFLAHQNGRLPVTAPAGSLESDNQDTGNLTFESRALSTTANSGYFDDIVLWRTNDQVVSAFGNDSCARP